MAYLDDIHGIRVATEKLVTQAQKGNASLEVIGGVLIDLKDCTCRLASAAEKFDQLFKDYLDIIQGKNIVGIGIKPGTPTDKP